MLLIVRTLREGYCEQKLLQSHPHERVPELENVGSLTFLYEKLTQKHVSRRSYQDENTQRSVCLYTLVSDACESALSKQRESP